MRKALAPHVLAALAAVAISGPLGAAPEPQRVAQAPEAKKAETAQRAVRTSRSQSLGR